MPAFIHCLISLENGHYQLHEDSLHLSKESKVFPASLKLQRMKMMEAFNPTDESTNYNFTVMFSADENAKEKVHSQFLKFLSSIEPIVKKAPAKSVYQIGFDLIEWS